LRRIIDVITAGETSTDFSRPASSIGGTEPNAEFASVVEVRGLRFSVARERAGGHGCDLGEPELPRRDQKSALR
jgi:hypothetical protein